MAVGARRSDILQQFLIELSWFVCSAASWEFRLPFSLGLVVSLLGAGISLVCSSTAIALAVVCSTLIGVLFGYLPARNASHLDPVAALSRE